MFGLISKVVLAMSLGTHCLKNKQETRCKFQRSEQKVFRYYSESQHLLLHADAFLEVGHKILALDGASIHAVRLQAVQHVHLELCALTVRLVVDDTPSHVGQRRTQERSQRHLSRRSIREIYFRIDLDPQISPKRAL